MKAIIHIGMEKTGSSSIQAWLRSNRALLKAERVYPNEGVGVLEGIRRLALKYAIFYVARDEMGVDEKSAWVGPAGRAPSLEREYFENYRLLTEQLEKISSKPGTFIYSHETIFRCRKIQMIALDKYLSRYFEDRVYVAYIRDTVDFFLSMYAQKLRNNIFYECGTLEYSEFLNRCTTGLVPYGLESSFGNLFEWEKVLGDKLNVRLLEPEWLVDGDLIEDFASLVGVPAFCKPGRRNESFAAEYIEYVRLLNLEYKRTLPLKIRRKALEILTKASSGKPKLAFSHAQSESIREIHRDQEERIRKRFFPDRKQLYSAKFRGRSIEPLPLTYRRKLEIESMIRERMAPEEWLPHKLADKRFGMNRQDYMETIKGPSRSSPRMSNNDA